MTNSEKRDQLKKVQKLLQEAWSLTYDMDKKDMTGVLCELRMAINSASCRTYDVEDELELEMITDELE